MKALLGLICFFCFWCRVNAQAPKDSLHYWSKIELADDSVFDKEFFYKDNFELPFYVSRDSLGYFRNIWSDQPLQQRDTIPHLITAQGLSSSRGEHAINQAYAFTKHDTVELFVGLFNPAYYDNYYFEMVNGKFSGRFHTAYFYPTKGKILWKTYKQKLYLNTLHPKKGAWLKGKVEYVCIEYIGNKPSEKHITMTSYFKLRVE